MNIAKIRRKTALQYADIQNKDSNTLYLVPDKGKIYLGDTALGGDTIEVMDPIPASPEDAGKIVKYINTTKQTLEGIDWKFGNYYKIGSKPSETVEVDVFESGTPYMKDVLLEELIHLADIYATPYVLMKASIPDTEHILSETRSDYGLGISIFTVSSLTDPVNEIKLYRPEQDSERIVYRSMTYNFTESYIIKNIEFAFDEELVFYIQDNYDNVHLVMPVSGNPFEQTVTLSNNEQIKCLLRCFDGPGQYTFYIQFVDIDDQHDVVSSLHFQVDDSGWAGTDSHIFTRDADYDFTQPLVVNISIDEEQEPYNLSWSERSPLQSDETHLYMRYYDIVEIEGELSDYTKCYSTGITFYVKDNQGYAYIADMYNGTASLSNTDEVQMIIDMTLESLPENTLPVWNTLQVQYPYISVVSTDKHLFYIELGEGNVIQYDLTDISYDVNTIQYNKTGVNVLILTSPTTLYWVTSDDDPVELEIENPDNAPVLFYGTNIFNSIDAIAALDESDYEELFENIKNTLVIVKDTNIGYVLDADTFTRVTLPYAVTDVLVVGGIYQFIVLDDNSAYCDIVYLQTHEERVIVNDPTTLYAVPITNVTEPVPATADNAGRTVQYIGTKVVEFEGLKWVPMSTYKIGSKPSETIITPAYKNAWNYLSPESQSSATSMEESFRIPEELAGKYKVGTVNEIGSIVVDSLTDPVDTIYIFIGNTIMEFNLDESIIVSSVYTNTDMYGIIIKNNQGVCYVYTMEYGLTSSGTFNIGNITVNYTSRNLLGVIVGYYLTCDTPDILNNIEIDNGRYDTDLQLLTCHPEEGETIHTFTITYDGSDYSVTLDLPTDVPASTITDTQAPFVKIGLLNDYDKYAFFPTSPFGDGLLAYKNDTNLYELRYNFVTLTWEEIIYSDPYVSWAGEVLYSDPLTVYSSNIKIGYGIINNKYGFLIYGLTNDRLLNYCYITPDELHPYSSLYTIDLSDYNINIYNNNFNFINYVEDFDEKTIIGNLTKFVIPLNKQQILQYLISEQTFQIINIDNPDNNEIMIQPTFVYDNLPEDFDSSWSEFICFPNNYIILYIGTNLNTLVYNNTLFNYTTEYISARYLRTEPLELTFSGFYDSSGQTHINVGILNDPEVIIRVNDPTVCINSPLQYSETPVKAGGERSNQIVQYLGEDQTYDGVEWKKGGIYRIGETEPQIGYTLTFEKAEEFNISPSEEMLQFPVLYVLKNKLLITYDTDNHKLYVYTNNVLEINGYNNIIKAGSNMVEPSTIIPWFKTKSAYYYICGQNAYSDRQLSITINGVSYSFELLYRLVSGTPSNYVMMAGLANLDPTLKENIAGVIINGTLFTIDFDLFEDQHIWIPASSFKIELKDGSLSDTITLNNSSETVSDWSAMYIYPTDGYQFKEYGDILLLYEEETGELYQFVLSGGDGQEAYPAGRMAFIDNEYIPAVPNLLYVTPMVVYMNVSGDSSVMEVGNHLVVTSDNKIIEYRINPSSNRIEEVYTYTDVDLTYTYTLFRPYIVGYKTNSNDIVLYNRKTHAVSYTSIPTTIKTTNIKIEKPLQIIHIFEGDTYAEYKLDVLGFKLQGVEDYFIYTTDGVNFAKYSVPENKKILGTADQVSFLLYVEDGTKEVMELVSDITETSVSSTEKIFQPGEGGGGDLSNYYTKSEVDTLLSSKANTATTLSGYGITDANINSGVITLGSNTITPVTVETDPVFTASPAATITSTMINNWNAAEANVLSDWNLTTTTADDYIKNKPAIINNLTSTSTTDILSAAQGKALNDTKADKATTLSGYGITDANINNGTITLGNNSITPITSHQSLDSCEAVTNKVTSISSSSTDTQYPSAKCLYDLLDNLEFVISAAINDLNDRVTALENNP